MILAKKKFLYLILVSEMILFIWIWIAILPKDIKYNISKALKFILDSIVVLNIPLVRSKRPLIITYSIGERYKYLLIITVIR